MNYIISYFEIFHHCSVTSVKKRKTWGESGLYKRQQRDAIFLKIFSYQRAVRTVSWRLIREISDYRRKLLHEKGMGRGRLLGEEPISSSSRESRAFLGTPNSAFSLSRRNADRIFVISLFNGYLIVKISIPLGGKLFIPLEDLKRRKHVLSVYTVYVTP